MHDIKLKNLRFISCYYQVKKHIFAIIKTHKMNQVIAHIDISTPIGRRLVKELEKYKKTVRVEYTLPDEISEAETLTHEEVFGKLEKKLNEHYGTNHKLKY